MKKILLSITLLIVISTAIPAKADVSVNIGITLPMVNFAAPPAVVPMPNTIGVYFVPDIDEDMFFWNGWWWRFHKGQWFRSHEYNKGWNRYDRTPSFYNGVDHSWRQNYKNKRWDGQQWESQRIPNKELKNNWQQWQKDNYWEQKRKGNNNRGQSAEKQMNKQENRGNGKQNNQNQYDQSQQMPDQMQHGNQNGQQNNSQRGHGKDNRYPEQRY